MLVVVAGVVGEEQSEEGDNWGSLSPILHLLQYSGEEVR